MLKKILFLFTLLFFYAGAQGQQDIYLKKIDSLKQAFSKTKTDTTKVNQLNAISRLSAGINDAENGKAYAEKAFAFATKINWSKGIVQSYISMAGQPGADVAGLLNKALNEALKGNDKLLAASVYQMLASTVNDAGKKIQYLEKALECYKQVDNYRLYAKILPQIAYAYETQGLFFEAIDYRMQSIKIAEKNNDIVGQINANRFLGLTYLNKGDKVKALHYYLATIALMKRDANKASALFMSDIHKETGKIYLDRKEYNKALIYFKDALKYSSEDKYIYAQIDVLPYISKTYQKLGNEQEAQLYFDKAKQLTDVMPLSLNKILGCSSVAGAAFESGNYQVALKYYQAMLDIMGKFKKGEEDFMQIYLIANSGLGKAYLSLAKQKGNNKELLLKSIGCLKKIAPVYAQTNSINDLKECYQQLAEAYELTGQYSESVAAYKDFIIYKDSLTSMERENAFVKKEAEFEYSRKEILLKAGQKAALDKEQTNRNYAFAGIGVLLLITGGAGVAYSRKRKDNRTIAAEKKRSDDLLLNILPAEVAEELKVKGEASAQYYEQVSIIFTDFVGFTKLSEKFSPEELIGELNYCFKAFDNIVTKYNIEKIKTIGDSYMAVSGLPGKNADHAKNAVEAAVEMRNFITNYKIERQAEGKVYFEMRTGINSGNVVAGIVGIKKFAYDVWGDAVNIASRMESNGIAGKINISESTFNLVKEDYETHYRGELDAKGKGLINMYFVERK